MSNKPLKYRVSSNTIRKANQSLIRKGISEKVRNSYNGDITVQVTFKDGIKTKVFSNNEIKTEFGKALITYAERV